jgi:hypothetical protein
MGLRDPLDEGLSQELGARVAPVDPRFLAAALGDGRDAGELLERGGVGKALAPFAERHEEARGERRTCARERREELVVGQLRRQVSDLGVEALDGLRDGAEL